MLNQAKIHLNKACHMLYTTFPLMQENHMLLSIFTEIYQAVRKIIIFLLNKERQKMNIQIYKDPKLNFKTFIHKVAPNYLKEGQLSTLIEILKINKKHSQASLEFVRKDKFVILINSEYEILTIQKIKDFYNTTQQIIKQIEEKI